MLYDIGIHFFSFILKALSQFNPKIKKGNTGRSETFQLLESNIRPNTSTIWFHCASLGEYEQGLPVFKILRDRYPTHHIVLTFFSPSGYENRKNSEIADSVVYLPMDNKKNAQRFTELLKPELAIFVKYEIWANYLNALHRIGCSTYLISAIFRKDQVYFKWYGGKLKQALKSFSHIFVQNQESKRLLQSIGYLDCTVSGDTRLDRVFQQLTEDNRLEWLENFKKEDILIVFGSTWPEDERYISRFINEHSGNHVKYLIVPHEISEKNILNIENSVREETARFTKDPLNTSSSRIMILDAIGYLSRTYSFADIAFIGGAVGKSGLHNIMEPAVFGLPIIIGSNYHKFPEATTLIDLEGVLSVKDYEEFSTKLGNLIENPEYRKKLGTISYNYIKNNKGSVIQITETIRI